MDGYIVNFLSLGHSFELLAPTLLQEKKKEHSRIKNSKT